MTFLVFVCNNALAYGRNACHRVAPIELALAVVASLPSIGITLHFYRNFH